MVTTVPPTNATTPWGASTDATSPTGVPLAAGAGISSGAPGTKAKVWSSVRVNTSGPISQRSVPLSSQWRSVPASWLTRATGTASVSLLSATAAPERGRGAT